MIGRALSHLLCLRAGHRWHTTTDAHGSITTCLRCDKLRHAGGTPLEGESYGADIGGGAR